MSSRVPLVVISRPSFLPAPERDFEDGLLSYARFTVNDMFVINGAKVRITDDRTRLEVAFPGVTDPWNKFHYHVSPCNTDIRDQTERQIFEAFRAEVNRRS